MSYDSLGDCHTTGFVILMSFSESGGNVVGTASSRPHRDRATLSLTLAWGT